MALCPEYLNILSICTGGGGLDLGFELAIPNARTVCMVEREGFAVSRLVQAMEAGLLAKAPIWSDARTFNGREWRKAVDGIVAGIPCQPHSEAGKRAGRNDERDLWATTRRVLVQSGAWFILIENVEGILSSGGAERVFDDLQRLGFQVEIGLYTASEIGDSQERRRLFILGVAALGGAQSFDCGPRLCEAKPISDGLGLGGAGGYLVEALDGANRGDFDGRPDIAGRGSEGRTTSVWAGARACFPPPPNDLCGWASLLKHRPDLEPAICRSPDGVADRTDILRMLGNGVVPLEAAYAIRSLAASLSKRCQRAARLVRMMGKAA